MDARMMLQDKHGQSVTIGDRVRVLAVSPGPELEDDEREMIEFMVGSLCEVERIDSHGRAWVSMWWNCGEGNAVTSVGLAAHEMERVASALRP
ncbi:MAG: hypothetical protein RBS40_10750 [Rhodocyclaceae bacterium]|jgi:hypothetical protein|nr:hypothetical protein [Rhodocyclaceae bacterium]